jgi:CRISPR-associated protein Cas2
VYVIIVYDIEVDRVNTVKKFLRTYLTWVQNSVFEGELTPAEFKRVLSGLKKIIDETKDSVRIYTFRSRYWVKSMDLGRKKAHDEQII